MANKKISELTAKAAQLQDDDLVMVSDYNGSTYDTKSVTGANIRPFKTILFAITQSGTAAPTKDWSYETEVSQTFTFTRTAAGTYKITASSALFTLNKTFVTLGSGGNPYALYGATRLSTTVIEFYSLNVSTNVGIDNALGETNLEIKIIK
ncbi:hypothetical protein EB001_06960 [bacterium]|nr:hypothetical protein [bacterium]